MRYFIELSYFGKKYHGWQRQPNAISIQEKIEDAMGVLLRKSISIVGAGRTDAGVHAVQLFAHFDVEKPLEANFIFRINSLLPNDIVIRKVLAVRDDAHSRFDALSRSYEYKIYIGSNPFLLDVSWQIRQKLDVNLMNEAAKILLDYEDFECFSKVKTEVFTFNCKVTEAEWKLTNNNELTFHVTANRFLRNMVRAIVGTLVDVGKGKTSLEQFREIIESKDRKKAGMSVPAKGLFLTKVTYDYINL